LECEVCPKTTEKLQKLVRAAGLSPVSAVFFPSRQNLLGGASLCTVGSLTQNSSCKRGSPGRACAGVADDAPAGELGAGRQPGLISEAGRLGEYQTQPLLWGSFREGGSGKRVRAGRNCVIMSQYV